MKKADNGVDYITPTSNATPTMYKPFDVSERLVVGAINIGKMLIAREDKKNPLRLCKHCQEVYIASRPNAVFCSTQCKNRYNVYKTRKKNKD